MSACKVAVDQRQFYRRIITNDALTGMLTYNQQQIPTWIVETSLGGFALVAESELDAPTDSLANLKVDGLDYIVRITHQQFLGDCVLIGLKKVEEIVPSSQRQQEGPIAKWITVGLWGIAICAAIVTTDLVVSSVNPTSQGRTWLALH